MKCSKYSKGKGVADLTGQRLSIVHSLKRTLGEILALDDVNPLIEEQHLQLRGVLYTLLGQVRKWHDDVIDSYVALKKLSDPNVRKGKAA